MGWFNQRKKQNLEEEVLKPRLDAIPSKNNEIGISDGDEDITKVQMETDSSIIDTDDVEKFTTLSRYLDERYAAYEDMLQDPIISAALEMYTDDATQINRDGNIIWAESDDPAIAEAANRLLRVLGINKYAWKHIYSLCTYGDLYLRLYKEDDLDDALSDTDEEYNGVTLQIKPDDKMRRLEERIEYVANPATVFDIQSKDKTSGFIRLKSKPVNSTVSNLNSDFLGGFNQPVSVLTPGGFKMMNNKSYVHISLSESITRFPQMLVIKNEDGEVSNAYQIKVGKSILEDAYSSARQLKLLENSLMLNRLTKSSLLRILQIEVGDSPEPETRRKIQRVKSMIEQKMSLNTQSGAARSYNAPGPIENIIYQATRDGKGAITETTIGGDVNVKDIVDIEFFQNRELAALKIPKQYLNFDSAEGFSNGTSLTKVSSRYAHTVMRIQNSYIQGITTLLNIFFLDKGLDYINKFTIKMVNPSTVEQTERDEQFSTRISQVDDLMRVFSDTDYSDKTKRKIFNALINDLVQIPSISAIINEADDEMDKIESENIENSDENLNDEFEEPQMTNDNIDDFESEDIEAGESDDTVPEDFGDSLSDLVDQNT